MLVYKTEQLQTVKEAPVGLFELESGTVIMITEYFEESGRREAFIVSSGERYHGEGDAAKGWPIILA